MLLGLTVFVHRKGPSSTLYKTIEIFGSFPTVPFRMAIVIHA